MKQDILYRWPAVAKFGRVVPKTKFNEHGSISAAVREKFVGEVQRITWTYKLADETIHLRGDHKVPEIQVFSIDAKGDDIGEAVLTAIDRSIPFPIIFEITTSSADDARVRMVAAHKVLGVRTPNMSMYLTTDWIPADTPRAPLPTAIDLTGLYAQLLQPLLPIDLRRGESLSEATARMAIIRKLEHDIAGLEQKMRRERQLNRKVELRRTLRLRTAELADLTATSAPKSKDVTWTN